VAENAASGTAVGTLSTVDPDAGNTFTYTLVSGDGSTDNASFTLDGAALKTAAVFNYETKSSYSIRVRSTDQGGLWTENAFTVSVTDVNEAPVVNAQSLAVPVSATVGTIVGTVAATDPDAGEVLSYVITAGNTGGAFAIDSATGELTVADPGALDPATTPIFNLAVEVTDSGSLSDTATITVGQGVFFGGRAKAVFRDHQGNLVTVALQGPGSGSVLLTDDLGWDVAAITLTGTTTWSFLSITTSPYLATTSVKDITVNGSLGRLVGRTTNLVGDITVTGSLRQLVLGDVTGPSDISINTADGTYTPPPQVRMTFGQVADCSINTNGLAIGLLRAARWLNSDGVDDTIRAPGIGYLMVTGKRFAARLGLPNIAGDFEGSLRLTGFDSARRPTLFLARIAGALADATWDVTGNVRFLSAGAVAGDLTGVFDGKIGVLRTRGDLSGTWTAQSVRVLWVGGSLEDADLTLTQAATPGSSATTLGYLSVHDWIDGASVSSAGHIGTLRAGAILDSNVFAGVTVTRDEDSDGRADLPDPDTDFDLLTMPAIRRVIINGIRGETYAMAGSNIAAPNLGRMAIGTVNAANHDDEPYGLAGKRLTSLRCASDLVLEAGDPPLLSLGDFTVRVIPS
jgi:hypothetical protein